MHRIELLKSMSEKIRNEIKMESVAMPILGTDVTTVEVRALEEIIDLLENANCQRIQLLKT